MQRYRSKQTFEAVQYKGQPIPGITCEGTDEQYAAYGCDNSRRRVPHVHTKATGGIRCLMVGDWIMPEPGGPWNVVSDAKFRANVEVPEDKPVVVAEPVVAEPVVAEPAVLVIAEPVVPEPAPTPEPDPVPEPLPTEFTENVGE